MKDLKYGMNTHIIPVLQPVDIAASTIRSSHVKISNALSAAFLINWGVITGDTVNIYVEESTAAATTGAETIGFGYRLTGDTDASSYGAVTTCDSLGTSHDDTDIDNLSMWLEVDLATMSEDCNYLCVKIVAASDPTLISVTAFLQVRYGQYDPLSTT
jgi:hypothetical protein